jgi:hypothetical protein
MKRITFITGHYGSGKTEFAVNLAMQKKADILMDLDIVNPYFRCREVETLLEENGVRMVASGLKNALGSDLPYISGEVFRPFVNEGLKAVIDLGGDPVGARLIRQFSDVIKDADVDLLLCINIYRESTKDAEGIENMMNLIEESGGLKVTGLINNSNLLRETTYEDILKGEEIILKVSDKTSRPLIYTGVYEKILPQCRALKGEIIPLRLYLRKSWL